MESIASNPFSALNEQRQQASDFVPELCRNCPVQQRLAELAFRHFKKAIVKTQVSAPDSQQIIGEIEAGNQVGQNMESLAQGCSGPSEIKGVVVSRFVCKSANLPTIPPA